MTRFWDYAHRLVFQKLQNTTIQKLGLFLYSGEEEAPTLLRPVTEVSSV
jgi:hypothetical protein